MTWRTKKEKVTFSIYTPASVPFWKMGKTRSVKGRKREKREERKGEHEGEKTPA